MTPTPLDRAALAAHAALADVAKDRERGVPVETADMLRRVAGAVITVHESYGARRCHSCAFWEPFRDAPRGQCGLVEGEADGVPYIVGEEGILVTPQGHGCLGWSRGDGRRLDDR